MSSVLAIAYDFGGALDIGATFAQTGLKVFLPMGTDLNRIDFPDDFQVTVADTELYGKPPELEYDGILALCQNAVRNGVEQVYLKTDSSLRGNIGIELKAVLDSFGGPLIFAPAYPQAGKTTVGGVQYVGELLLHRTARANDTINSIATSDVGEIIHMQANISTISCTPMADSFPDPDAVYIFDSRNRDDLRQIAENVHRRHAGKSLAGCSGFGEYMKEMLFDKAVSGLEMLCGNTRADHTSDYKAMKGFNTAYTTLIQSGCKGLVLLGRDKDGRILASDNSRDDGVKVAIIP